jgi:hypothetical protein
MAWVFKWVRMSLRNLIKIVGDNGKVEYWRKWHWRRLKVTHYLNVTYKGQTIRSNVPRSIFYPKFLVMKDYCDLIHAFIVFMDLDDKNDMNGKLLKKVVDAAEASFRTKNAYEYVYKHFKMSIQDFIKDLADPNIKITLKHIEAIKFITAMDEANEKADRF